MDSLEPPPEDDGAPSEIELVGHLAELLCAGGAAGTVQEGLNAASPVLNAFASSVKAGQEALRPLAPKAHCALGRVQGEVLALLASRDCPGELR